MEKSKSMIIKNALSNTSTKTWIVIGIGVAGILIYSETRRRRNNQKAVIKEDFGAFVHSFEILPFPQPPPPAARLPLSGLTFAVNDNFDIKEYVSGFGNPDWEKTHDPATKSALVVTWMLKNGATFVGKTVMDELAFGITGENLHYGTPTNPLTPSHIPGGSSSGSAVAVAAKLVDFAIGTDTLGCVRTPASFCGILGFRPSHGAVSSIGVLPNAQSLDTIGWFARDPSILHRAGQILLRLSPGGLKKAKRLIFAEDCFQLSKVPKHKSVQVVKKSTENLSGYLPPKNVNIGQYIASNVSSLKGFYEPSANLQHGTSTLKALSNVMVLLQRYEFKTNHEEWIETAKPKLGPEISVRVLEAAKATHENIKTFYKVKTELRSALQSLLQDDGILVIPTISDLSLKLNAKKKLCTEFQDRAFALLSIAGMSGCCQVSCSLVNLRVDSSLFLELPQNTWI